MFPQLSKMLYQLKQALAALYGEQLSQVILFGSQAREEAEPDSDIDIMVVLKTEPELQQEERRVAEVTAPLSLEYDVVISCITLAEQRFLSEDTPFLRNVRQEGVVL